MSDKAMQDAWDEHCPHPDIMNEEAVKYGRGFFYAGYKDAKQESHWVPIDEIPEEWKDGRSLLSFDIKLGYWTKDWFFRNGKLSQIKNATHAMLSPSPPEE